MMLDPAASMRRAATLLERASVLAGEANELELPKLLFRGRAIERMERVYADAVVHGRQALALLDGATGPGADAVRGVDELLAKIDPAARAPDNGGLARARAYSDVRDVASQLQLRGDRLRLLAEHAGDEPAQVRAALDAQVRAITSKPFDQVTHADVHRLATIDGLPGELRPAMPPRLRDNYAPEALVLRRMLPGSDNIARGEFEMHRLAHLREAIEADPGATRAALDAEVRAIVATPNDRVTAEQVRRLSTIAGLGDELRPALLDVPVPWPQHRLADLSAWGWTPARDGDARAKFDAIRMAIQHEAMLADPAVTREAVGRELAELLAIPDSSLTTQQLHRTSVLARLPQHLRPPMPDRLDNHYAFENLGLLGYHPAGNRAAAKVFDQARVHMAAVLDPQVTIERLAARVRAGEPIDFRVLAALDGHDELLQAHGLTHEVLDRIAVRAIAGAGSGSRDELRVLLERMRARFVAIPDSDPRLASVRSNALELLERNLDRMAGRRSDTFSRHPDYAEVGRIVASAELLDAMRAPAGRAPAAAPVESLAW